MQFHFAVGDEHRGPRRHVAHDVLDIHVDHLARRGNIGFDARPAHLHPVARRKADAVGIGVVHARHANLGTLRVEHDGDRIRNAAHHADDLGGIFQRGVRRIDPHDVHSRLEQASHQLFRATLHRERRHYFRSFNHNRRLISIISAKEVPLPPNGRSRDRNP